MTEAWSRRIAENIKKEEIIGLITDLVGCPSHEGIERQETDTAAKIFDFFKKEGIPTELVPVVDGRCNVIARIKGSSGGRSLLLTGHTDTVPPYEMPHPYEVKVTDGKMLGRGVVDMKGALACMMIAMAALKRSGEALGGDIIFAGVIDEEDSSLGAKALLKRGLRADAAIVGEPTEMEVCIGHKGVEWFEVQFQGKAVHGGRPKDGINAIQKAAAFIGRVERDLVPKLEKRIHPIIGESTLNYGVIKGGTQPSTVAGECTLQLSRRWIPSESYESVVSDFEQILNELRAEDPQFSAVFRPMEEGLINQEANETGSHHEALETQAEHPVVLAALNAVKSVCGKEKGPGAFDAWSDGGILSAGGRIPSIVLGPGNLSSAHSPDEYLEVGAVVPAALIYALTAIEFCH